MAPLRLILPFAVASVVLLLGAYGQQVPDLETEGAEPQTTAANCLDEMNKARKAVGYEPFNPTDSANEKVLIENKALWGAFCRGMLKLPAEVDDEEVLKTIDGTPAYAEQEQQDCGAAVEYWKGGFSSFGTELPPEYAESEENKRLGKKPYDTIQAVSFVALYNPKKNANADCVFLTCPKNPLSAGEAGRRLSAAATLKALVCLSHPNAFGQNQRPYNEEEWKKITDVFAPESSASAAAPAFLVLVAAAVGLAVL